MIKIGADIQGIKPLRTDLKSTIHNLSKHLFGEVQPKRNPVLTASHCWKIASEQLQDILGCEIHRQWFSNVRPLVVSDNLLILQTPNRSSALWINKHYQNLVDLLLSFQDKDLSSFFICPSDVNTTESERYENTNGQNY